MAILEDLGRNRTYVNGAPVPDRDGRPPVPQPEGAGGPWRWAELRDGDRVALVRGADGQERHVFVVARP